MYENLTLLPNSSKLVALYSFYNRRLNSLHFPCFIEPSYSVCFSSKRIMIRTITHFLHLSKSTKRKEKLVIPRVCWSSRMITRQCKRLFQLQITYVFECGSHVYWPASELWITLIPYYYMSTLLKLHMFSEVTSTYTITYFP